MTLITRPLLARRKIRLRELLLRLPLSTQRLMVYSSATHSHMLASRDGAWLGPWGSPLGGYLDAQDGRAARQVVEYVDWGQVAAPAEPLAPGIIGKGE